MKLLSNGALSLDIIIPAFNASRSIIKLLQSIDSQKAHDFRVNVIVANDASTDNTLQILESYAAKSFNLKIINISQNLGRAQACNQAVKHGSNDYILFIDADCYFEHGAVLQTFKRLATDPKTIVFGFLKSSGSDFWSYYFNRAQGKKRPNSPLLFSSTNMLISRELIEKVGGFCSAYTHYGFEDRDLICRITAMPDISIAHAREAVLIHNSDETLDTYCRKFYSSGRHSASVFSKRHPREYRNSVYYRFDYSKQRWMKAPAILCHSLQPLLRRAANKRLDSSSPQSRMTQLLVQMCAAIAYWEGTRDAQ